MQMPKGQHAVGRVVASMQYGVWWLTGLAQYSCQA